ncbi:MAG: PQQ-like beta-propeller repeat protein, partial [Verrucomicrobiae bacterium]|nr:PQQ-like beta-propeller repeat protein [Verrucomicrobiae bacterium]
SHAIYALDKATGEEKWKWQTDSLSSIYGTPVISTVEGRDDLIIGVSGEIWGMNPDTGKLRWFAGTGLTGNIAPSPVIAGDRIVQFGGYPSTMGVGIKAGGKGDVTQSHRLWQNNDAKSYLTSPVFHEGHLYWVSDAGIACCANPDTGELLYETRLEGASGQGGRGKPFYASPVIVNGHLLAVSRTAGTFIIEAKPEFTQVRVNRIGGDDSRFQGTPAISDGRLYLRSDKALYCIGQ